MKVRWGLMTNAAAAAAAFLVIGATASVSPAAEDGKALFDKNCKSCHGDAGKGDGPASKMMKPPPKGFAEALKGQSDADITKVIKEGGKAVGKSAMMPAYGTKLNDEQLKAVVEYSKTLAK